MRSDRRSWILAGVLSLLAVACDSRREPRQQPTGDVKASASGKARIPAFSATADDGQWLTAQKDFANTRFSGLNQINLSNVDQLKVVTTFSTGMVNGHEAGPLVVGHTMYLVTPFPNVLYALNLAEPGGATKWVFRPDP